MTEKELTRVEGNQIVCNLCDRWRTKNDHAGQVATAMHRREAHGRRN